MENGNIINLGDVRDKRCDIDTQYERCASILKRALYDLDNHKRMPGIQDIIFLLRSSIKDISPQD